MEQTVEPQSRSTVRVPVAAGVGNGEVTLEVSLTSTTGRTGRHAGRDPRQRAGRLGGPRSRRPRRRSWSSCSASACGATSAVGGASRAADAAAGDEHAAADETAAGGRDRSEPTRPMTRLPSRLPRPSTPPRRPTTTPRRNPPVTDADRIGRASAFLASGTIVSRVLGFVKAIIVAATIGVVGSAGADAFAVANGLPNTVYVIVAGGVLSAVLVPQIVRAGAHADGGSAYINKLLTVALVILAAATVAGDGAGAAPDPPLRRHAAAARPSNSRSPSRGGACRRSSSTASTRCSARCSTPGAASAPSRGCRCSTTWWRSPACSCSRRCSASTPTARGPADAWTPAMVAVLAGSATAGIAAQALILFWFWRRIGLRYRPDFAWRGVGLGTAGRMAGWTFGMLLLTTFAGIVQTQVARHGVGRRAPRSRRSTTRG